MRGGTASMLPQSVKDLRSRIVLDGGASGDSTGNRPPTNDQVGCLQCLLSTWNDNWRIR